MQFQDFVAAPGTRTVDGPLVHTGRIAFALIGLVMLIAALAGAAVLLGQPLERSAPAADERAVTDGWMPAISAANEARRFQAASATVDGWMPRLLVQDNPDEILDGWAARYLVSDTDEILDGWAVRYLVSDED